MDTSAVVAILRREPEARRFSDAIESAATVRMSTASALECSMVLGELVDAELDALLARSVILEPVDAAQLSLARVAHRRYGRGSGSRARLNFGDCFAYALAVAKGEPLLFKGDDFGHTDVLVA